ncbi:hypothetical protein JCM10213_000503 [Rhodosporidiobolus nylandii]
MPPKASTSAQPTKKKKRFGTTPTWNALDPKHAQELTLTAHSAIRRFQQKHPGVEIGPSYGKCIGIRYIEGGCAADCSASHQAEDVCPHGHYREILKPVKRRGKETLAEKDEDWDSDADEPLEPESYGKWQPYCLECEYAYKRHRNSVRSRRGVPYAKSTNAKTTHVDRPATLQNDLDRIATLVRIKLSKDRDKFKDPNLDKAISFYIRMMYYGEIRGSEYQREVDVDVLFSMLAAMDGICADYYSAQHLYIGRPGQPLCKLVTGDRLNPRTPYDDDQQIVVATSMPTNRLYYDIPLAGRQLFTHALERAYTNARNPKDLDPTAPPRPSTSDDPPLHRLDLFQSRMHTVWSAQNKSIATRKANGTVGEDEEVWEFEELWAEWEARGGKCYVSGASVLDSPLLWWQSWDRYTNETGYVKGKVGPMLWPLNAAKDIWPCFATRDKLDEECERRGINGMPVEEAIAQIMCDDWLAEFLESYKFYSADVYQQLDKLEDEATMWGPENDSFVASRMREVLYVQQDAADGVSDDSGDAEADHLSDFDDDALPGEPDAPFAGAGVELEEKSDEPEEEGEDDADREPASDSDVEEDRRLAAGSGTSMLNFLT